MIQVHLILYFPSDSLFWLTKFSLSILSYHPPPILIQHPVLPPFLSSPNFLLWLPNHFANAPITSLTPQLVLHMLFNLCILIYASIQIVQTRTALTNLGPTARCGAYIRCTGPDSLFNVVFGLFIVEPIVVGLASIGFALLIRKLYREFGWAEFRLVGGSPKMKREFCPSEPCPYSAHGKVVPVLPTEEQWSG